MIKVSGEHGVDVERGVDGPTEVRVERVKALKGSAEVFDSGNFEYFGLTLYSKATTIAVEGSAATILAE